MTGYLLSVEELNSGPGAERLYQEALEKLDECRLEKALRIRPGKARSQAVGAGLLLQFAVQRMREDFVQTGDPGRETRSPAEFGMPTDFERLTVSDILERLGAPVSVTYRYGAHGKPDFEDRPGHFNLSHSENFVCGVFAREEVGVDIQRRKPLRNLHLAERYFSKREQLALAACADREQRERLFYRIWVKKEAYGKLTGEGIAAAVALDTDALSELAEWREYELQEGYCMAVCRRRTDRNLENHENHMGSEI